MKHELKCTVHCYAKDGKVYQNKAHLTAISRSKVSQPMRWLYENDMLHGETKLDYGCGKGFDADHFEMDKFDPYYFNTNLKSSHYETITCNYVLNVIQSDSELVDCLKKIQDLLTQLGIAYITVRRDVKESYVSKRGTFQRPVYLNLNSLRKTSQYETYILTKNSQINTQVLKQSDR